MNISEVMSTDVEVINIDSTIQEAAKKMRDGDFGSIPVEENERLAGMLTDRDITIRAVAEGEDVRNMKVRDCMSKGIEYCFEDESIEDVSDKMAQSQIRRLPVLNRDKRLVGIVSIGDLALKERGDSATHEALKDIVQH